VAGARSGDHDWRRESQQSVSARVRLVFALGQNAAVA
jgi:hypothetical protein